MERKKVNVFVIVPVFAKVIFAKHIKRLSSVKKNSSKLHCNGLYEMSKTSHLYQLFTKHVIRYVNNF